MKNVVQLLFYDRISFHFTACRRLGQSFFTATRTRIFPPAPDTRSEVLELVVLEEDEPEPGRVSGAEAQIVNWTAQKAA